MATIRIIVLSYGTPSGKVVSMFPNTYTTSQVGQRPLAKAHPVDADDARMNPWLLWRPEGPQAPQVLTSAEMDECRCPGLCNRDHVNE
jgi:hypothetical protein